MRGALIACALLLFIIVGLPRAHAQTATQTYSWSSFEGDCQNKTSAQEACDCHRAHRDLSDPSSSPFTSTFEEPLTCRDRDKLGNLSGGVTLSKAGPTYSCPGGSVLSGGSTCTCPSGHPWNGITCGGTAIDCAARQGIVSQVKGDTFGAPTMCVGGCSSSVDTSVCSMGGTLCSSFGKFTGSTCNQPDPANTTGVNTCGDGLCPVTVSGQQVCLTCGKSGTTPMSKTITNDTLANGTSKRSNTVTACNGSVCTTTTVTKDYDANGAEIPGTTTTKEASEDDPNKKKQSECDDATAASALISCAQLGTPSSAVTVASTTVGPSTITPAAGLATAGACPADIPLPMGMSFSFSGICQGGNALRPVIIAIAWLTAGFIVFGGLKRG
jgi:hypothetical protein